MLARGVIQAGEHAAIGRHPIRLAVGPQRPQLHFQCLQLADAARDMADVIVRRDNTSAALSLEILWNRLATEHTFSLVCGYAVS